MSFVERYWPTLVAIPVMAGVGLWFWSNRTADQITEEPPDLGEQTASVESERALEREADSEIPSDFKGSETGSVLQPLTPPDARVKYRETLQFLEGTPGEAGKDFTQDSPEVKQALSQVKIELYGTADCVHCEAAREFMKANQIRFTDHDVEADAMKKETARRLSGGTGVPVIVIDGQVLRGFSQSAFQAALTTAVRARVSG